MSAATPPIESNRRVVPLRTLVVGGGSIGARHLNNLAGAGVTPLALVDPLKERRSSLCADGSIAGFETIEQGLSWGPELVVVASPTSMHIEHAMAAARCGCHLFVEKPLAHSRDGIPELVAEVRQRAVISLVGCNMRFHPGPLKVKELLERQSIGKVLFARIHSGSYLPNWRSSQDYRQTYSANAGMGGGCILDSIHEIDLAYWYMGGVETTFCAAEHLSSMEIDVEDVAMLICKHETGSLSEIELDYVQRTYDRGCHIVGEEGTITWDFGCGTVRHFDARRGSWIEFAQPDGWELNRMYVDELNHLLACIRTGSQATLSISQAANVMSIAFAARKSAGTGRLIATTETS
jgi:predicted dehydrogenase